MPTATPVRGPSQAVHLCTRLERSMLRSSNARRFDDAAALVEFTFLLPVLFSILFGVTIASDILFTKTENLNLSRELGNYAMRNCRTVQDDPLTPANEVDVCLSAAKEIVDNLSGNSDLQFGSIVTAYDCLTYSCTDSSGLDCPVEGVGCSCVCTEVLMTGSTEPAPVTVAPRPGELPSIVPAPQIDPFLVSSRVLLPPRITQVTECAGLGTCSALMNRSNRWNGAGQPDEAHVVGVRPSEAPVPVAVSSRFDVAAITGAPELLTLFSFRRRIFIAETRLRFSELNSTGTDPTAYDVSIF